MAKVGRHKLGHEFRQGVCGDKRRNHPLTLTTPQELSQANKPTAKSFQGPGGEAGPSRTMFRHVKRKRIDVFEEKEYWGN